MSIKYKKRTIPYARKRSGKTDYRKRLSLVKSGKIRLCVRRMLNNISVQFIEFHPDGDKTLVGVHSRELLKLGWKAHCGNVPVAYLTGYMAGLKALKKGVSSAIVDFGMLRSVAGGRIYAVVKGVIDAGLKINCKEDMFPKEESLSGKTIEDYAKLLGEGVKIKYSQCIKNGLDVKNFSKHSADIKKEIEKKYK